MISELDINDYQEYLMLMKDFRPVKTNMTKDEFTLIYNKIKNNGKIFIYKVDNKIVASITIIEEYKFINNNGKVCHIEDVFVNEHYRNIGIASKLIKYVSTYCIKNNFYKMILNCDKDLVDYYQKFGFIEKISMIKKFNQV